MTLLGETRTCKRSSDRERRTRGQRSRRIHQQVCTDSDERDDRLPETASFSSLNPVTSNMQTSSKVFLLGTVGYSLLKSLSDTASIRVTDRACSCRLPEVVIIIGGVRAMGGRTGNSLPLAHARYTSCHSPADI